MSPESPPQHTPPDRRATLVFFLICAAVAAAIAVYALFGRRPVAAPESAAAPLDPSVVSAARRTPHLLFRITALGPSYGRVGIVPLDRPQDPPLVTHLACDRVHASAHDGLCLQASRGMLTTYKAIAFDAALAERHAFTLPGAPSRTRVAADAAMAASTVFVSGDSYAAGGFSTRTSIYDLAGRTLVGDLESFAVLQDGQPFKKQDFNFWGVTFRDADRFYATLGTGGDIHLVEGSVAGRTMTVAGAGIECPALSPDGRRLVFKARTVEGGRVIWRLRVIDLATRAVVELAERRSVDDQAEWLDDRRVLYALPSEGTGSGASDIWAVPADGTGSPEVFVRHAFSPAVVRQS